eukprot:3807381-Pleurochrysis_carterae.AAC.2
MSRKSRCGVSTVSGRCREASCISHLGVRQPPGDSVRRLGRGNNALAPINLYLRLVAVDGLAVACLAVR